MAQKLLVRIQQLQNYLELISSIEILMVTNFLANVFWTWTPDLQFALVIDRLNLYLFFFDFRKGVQNG